MSGDSERQLQDSYSARISELATDLFCVIGRDGVVLFVNSAVTVLGYTPDDLLRTNLLARVHPDDVFETEAQLAMAAPGRGPIRFENRCRDRAGEFRWVTWLVSRADDQTWTAMISDATEHKWVERELEASLSLVEATLESTADGILVADRSGKVVTFNRRFLALWEIPDAVVFSGCAEVDAFCDRILTPAEEHLSLARELIEAPKKERYEMLNLADGRIFERYSLPRWIRSEIEGRVWSFRDVSERVRAELELRSHLAMGIEHAVEGIARLDEKGRYIAVNQVFAKMFGYEEHELISSEWGARAHPEDRAAVKAARDHVLGAGKEEVEARLIRKDGSLAVVRALIVKGNDGHHVFVRDVTEQKELQERLRLADRMASMGTLAAGVAHEINNPLSFVIANATLLSELLPPLGSEVSAKKLGELIELVRDIRDGAERVRKIVRDLKMFSRPDEASGAVDVRSVLDSSINLAWNEIRHRARLVKDFGPVGLVEGNDAQLGQVFLNLLINAAQAIPEGNADRHEIRIVTRIDPHDDLRLEVLIQDTGCGIAPGILPRIFDPFFTTKPVGAGTGLGLSVCHGIVAKLGGAIQVESTPGAGTTFRLTLRRGRERPKIVVPPAEPPSSLGDPRGRVLVVDDEILIANALRRVLAKEHDVVVCTSGREALTTLAAERFDLVLCDVMMPDVSGMDVYDELRRSAPKTAERMVFMTGGSFTVRAKEFLDRVPNARLDKPIDVKMLRGWIRERLSSA